MVHACGGAENAGRENAGHQIAGHKRAGYETDSEVANAYVSK